MGVSLVIIHFERTRKPMAMGMFMGYEWDSDCQCGMIPPKNGGVS